MFQNKKKPAMTPRHPRWNEFISRLRSPEGINYKKVDSYVCSGKIMFTPKILIDMGCDVNKTLFFFKNKNLFCDCEIALRYNKYIALDKSIKNNV